MFNDRRLRTWGTLAVVLAAALAVRAWAMRWPPFPTDMGTWIAWGERMRELGPGGFYAEGVFADYIPGYLYILWLVAAVKHAFFASADQGTYQVLHRLPATLCDLATGALIFVLVRRLQNDAAPPTREQPPTVTPWPVLPAIGALLYLFNPAVIFNSAVWGQVDSTFTLLMLATLILLLRGRLELAVVSYALAFLIKPQAISLAPVVGLVALLRYPLWRVAGAAGYAVIVSFVLLLPFFGLDAFTDLLTRLRISTNTYAFTSLFSYNFWGIYDFWKDDRTVFAFGLSSRNFSLLLYLFGLAYGCNALFQELRRHTWLPYTVFAFATYFTFLPVMVLTRMHERYLYPVLVMLLLFAVICQMMSADRERRLPNARFLAVPLILYVALTLLHTLNLYHVYQFYLYFDAGGVPGSNRLFYHVAGNAKNWSVLTLLAFTTFTVLLSFWFPERPAIREEASGPAPVDEGVAPV